MKHLMSYLRELRQRLSEDAMDCQHNIILIEQTAAMLGILIVTLGLMQVVRYAFDESLEQFVLALGIVMNGLCAFRGFMKASRLQVWIALGMALLYAMGLLYLLAA